MEPAKNTSKPVTPALYFGQILQSVNIMTLVHLNSLQDSEHVYSGEYSKALYELADELIESYQGTLSNRSRVNIIIPGSSYCHPNQHLTSFSQYLKSHRNIFGEDSSLQIIIDRILNLINKTNYQLSL